MVMAIGSLLQSQYYKLTIDNFCIMKNKYIFCIKCKSRRFYNTADQVVRVDVLFTRARHFHDNTMLPFDSIKVA